MVIKGTVSCPPKSAKEYAKRVTNLLPLPEYITIKGPYTKSTSREGITAITLYEFEESRFAEASKHIFHSLGAFYGVPGFTFSTQVWLKAKDAYESINRA